MKKGTLASYILGILGGLLLAIGLVMTLIEIEELFVIGIIVGVVGLVLLALIYPIYAKTHHKKIINMSKKAKWLTVFGVISFLVMGAGMSIVLVYSDYLMYGMIAGSVGIVLSIIFMFMLIAFLGHPIKMNRNQKRSVVLGTIYFIVLMVATGLFLSNPVFTTLVNFIALSLGFIALTLALLNPVFYKYRISNKEGK